MTTNKFFKKASSLALATVLSVGTFSSAFAADTTNQPQFSAAPTHFTKVFTVKKDVAMPNVSFTFNVEGTTDGPTSETSNGSTTLPKAADIKVAPAGLVSLTNDTVEFGNDTATQKTVGLAYDLSKITDGGVYRVKITETQGTYRGLTYDDNTKYMDIYVTRNSNGQLEITSTVIYNDKGEKLPGRNEKPTDGSVSFENRYFVNNDDNDTPKTPEKTPDPTDPENPTNPSTDPNPSTPPTVPDPNKEYNVEVGKWVSRSNAILEDNKDFEISIAVTGGNTGERYNVYDANNTLLGTLTSGAAQTFKIKHGQKVNITGLTADDKITVTEVNVPNGYTRLGEVSGVYVGNLKTDVIVVNKTTNTVPTGIIENILPFVVIIAVAGGFAYVYYNKNKEEQFA